MAPTVSTLPKHPSSAPAAPPLDHTASSATRFAREALVRKRFVATGIDLALAMLALLVLGRVHWAYIVLTVAGFLLRDWGECYSPGKRVMGLWVVDRDARSCTFVGSVVRNATLLPPLLFVELAMLLFSDGSPRLGDLLASTHVIAADLPEIDIDDAPHAESNGDLHPPQTLDAGTLEVLSHEYASDGFDAAIIDPGLLTPDRLTPEELEAADAEETPAPGAPPAPSAAPPPPPAAKSISLELAARCIGIEGEVTYDSLDDAYWHYVDRYSPDAADGLPEAELHARCAEIAAAKAGLPMELPPPVAADADRESCMLYLNDWLMLVNKCRDSLS